MLLRFEFVNHSSSSDFSLKTPKIRRNMKIQSMYLSGGTKWINSSHGYEYPKYPQTMGSDILYYSPCTNILYAYLFSLVSSIIRARIEIKPSARDKLITIAFFTLSFSNTESNCVQAKKEKSIISKTHKISLTC